MRIPEEKRRLMRRIRNIVIFMLIGIGIYFILTKEQRAFNTAKKANNIESYEDFLSKYPGSKYTEMVYECMYNIVIVKENADDLLQFYQAYPYMQNAMTVLNTGISLLYKETISQNTMEGWDDFLRRIKQFSEYEEEELDQKTNELDLDDDIESNQRKKTVLIKNYVDSAKRQRIECLFSLKEEEKIWSFVQSENTIEYYKKYMENFPKGKYARECNKFIIDMEIDEIFFSGEYDQLPPMEKANMNTSSIKRGYSLIEITNNTEYEITIRYSGKVESKKIVLFSQKTRTIRLLNGHYRIAASVDAFNVRDYAGEETLEGTFYEIEYYIRDIGYGRLP
ncbi:MAG: hypothetical protein LBE13_18365 [Bacteroidales bacterium]|jgi:hypothetical protein|nr:hypothetical protein [Bacteroidales bacterium]